jgi:hypothetical protein
VREIFDTDSMSCGELGVVCSPARGIGQEGVGMRSAFLPDCRTHATRPAPFDLASGGQSSGCGSERGVGSRQADGPLSPADWRFDMSFHFLMRALAVALAASLSLPGSAGEVLAQTSSLPTYDYDASTPGTQPPTSPLVQGYESRVFRTLALGVPVFVPLPELQAILPEGFTAIANPSGSTTALITLGLTYHQRGERIGGRDGPVSTVNVTAAVFNSLLQRNETVILANEQNEPVSVTNVNALQGEGASRLARVDTEIEENDGLVYVRFDVRDKDLGLRLRVQAVGPAVIGTRVVADPSSLPVRAVSGRTARNSMRVTTQYDNNAVEITRHNLRVHAPARTLRLPGGDLTIVQMGATMTFQRWREQFLKLEPGQ